MHILNELLLPPWGKAGKGVPLIGGHCSSFIGSQKSLSKSATISFSIFIPSFSRSSRSDAAEIDFAGSGRKTKKLIAAEKISKTLGGNALFRRLDLTLSPGMRVGVVGPNGSGKSSLLRVLLGELEPDEGTVMRASDLRVVTFDQNRAALSRELSVKRVLAPEGDTVFFREQPIHVAGWAKRFLFRPEQLEMPVYALS